MVRVTLLVFAVLAATVLVVPGTRACPATPSPAPLTSPSYLPPPARQYIYISREEMGAVADYIRQRGRVAIGELAARSATLIDLEPRPEDGGATAAAAAGGRGAAAGGLDFEQLLAAA